MTKGWETVAGPEEVTANISGWVTRSDKVSGVYVTLHFPNYTMTMHEQMARQLRDWLVANVPDA